jgi:hypothetical protein
MGTPVNERMKAYRARLRDRGWQQVAMYLSPEALEQLEQLKEQYPDSSVGEIVSLILVQQSRLIDPAAHYHTGQNGEETP